MDHKPVLDDLLQDILGPLKRGGKWDPKGTGSLTWVYRAPCDEWAGHSPTLQMAPSTQVSPQSPGSWARSILGSSAVTLVTLRVLPALESACHDILLCRMHQ